MNSPSSPTVRVAILDDYQQLASKLADWQSLPGHVDLEFISLALPDENELVQRLQPFDVVVAMRERTAFPASVIERLPKLKLIASTGLRNAAIDLDACRRRGIATCGAKGGRNSLATTAEMAWALILALHKRVVASHNALHEGRWQPELAEGLAGNVLGLVGLGNIGQRMARIAQAFDMDVIAWSPNLTDERALNAGARRVDKAELFSRADVVSLHLVLSASTIGVVSAAELSTMKPSAFLINTSRAGLVDEKDLLEALEHRRIAGAGLDVFWKEPLHQDHPLSRLDGQVVLTPHLGYATAENLRAYYGGVIANIKTWLEGRELLPLAQA